MDEIPTTKEKADGLLKEANDLVQIAWSISRHLPDAQRNRKTKPANPVVLIDESRGNAETCGKLIDAAGKYEVVGAAYMNLGCYKEASKAFQQAVRIWSMPVIKAAVADASLRAQSAAANSAAMTTLANGRKVGR